MKQTLFVLLCTVYTFTAWTQTNNILRGVVSIKGEDKKPLKGVSLQAVGISNKAFTDDNGFYELKCTGMSAGDVVSLIVSKDGYVILDKSVLQEVPIRKDPNRRFDFVMQEEGKRKTDVERAEKNIKDNINRKTDEQTKVLDARLSGIESKLQQSSINDIERKAYTDSIQKLNTERYDLINDRDKALQLARETAEKLTTFDTEGASKELKQAQTLFEAGKLDSAYAAINELAIQRKVQTSKTLLKSAIQDYMYKGRLAIANGKFDEAERLYTEGVHLDSTHIDNLWTLAYFLADQNKTEKAIFYYRNALSLSQSESVIASFYNNLGLCYSTIENMPEAEKMYLRAVDIREKLVKNDSLQFESDLATSLDNLGSLYYTVNRKSEAEKMFLRALDIKERLAESNPAKFESYLINTLSSLAAFYLDASQMDEAERMYIRRYVVAERLYSKDTLQFEYSFAKALLALGGFYTISERLPQAESMLLRALNIYERLAKYNPAKFEAELALAIQILSLHYQMLGNPKEIEQMHMRALEIYEHLAKDNPRQFESGLALTLHTFGMLLVKSQMFDKAIPLYHRSLILYQKALLNGQKHREEGYNSILGSLIALRDSFQAYNNYPKIVEIQTELAQCKNSLKGVFIKGDSTAAAEYGALSWFQLFAEQYPAAEQSAKLGLALDATQIWIHTNLGHALLFQNKDAAAKKVYDDLKILKNTEGDSFRGMLNEDFDALEQAGLDKKQLDKARKWVKTD